MIKDNMSSNQFPLNSGFNEVSFIFFDLDDTLIDHKKAQKRALMDLWSHFPQLQMVSPEAFAAAYAEVNNRLWEAYRNNDVDQYTLKRRRLEYTFGELQVEMPDWKEADEIYMQYYQRHWEWIDDAREAFITLSKRYKVGIMTNGFTEVQKKKFEFFSLHRFSRNLIISEEVGYLKPDSRIFEYSAEQVNYPAEQLLYVGDSYSSDILGGKQSGWKTAWYVPQGPGPEADAADFSFRHFSQLTEALSPSH